MEGFLWAGGIIIGLFAFLSTFQPVVDLIYKVFGLTRIQPKLAISLTFDNKGRSVKSSAYLPSTIKPGDTIGYDRQHELIYDYLFFWDYEITVTNQAEYPDVNTRISQVIGTSTDIHFMEGSIDRTIPFAFNVPKTYKIRFNRMYRCDLRQAEEVGKNKPFTKLILQYTNLDGKKYYTQFTNDNGEIVNKFGKEKSKYSFFGFEFYF